MLRKMVNTFSRNSAVPELLIRPFSIFKSSRLDDDIATVVEKAGENIDEANQFATKNILSKVTPIEANLRCNQMLAGDLAFREKCQEMVKKQITLTTPSISWKPFSDKNALVPAFRSVAPCGVYGTPEYIFKYGMPAALFNMRPHKLPLSQARINSYVALPQSDGGVEIKLAIENRKDMFGFTFGPLVAFSLNIGYCALQRYTFPHMRFKTDNYLYLVAVEAGYSVADTIHHGVGYSHDRNKGVSNAEDAREVTPGVYLPTQKILGCREVKASGELGHFMPNPSANVDEFAEMFRFIDVQIFMESKTVAEIRMLESAIYPEVRNHEDAIPRMNELHDQNKQLQQQIQREAIALREGIPVVSNLLRQQCADHKAGFCDHSFHLFAVSQQLKAAKNNGTILDSKSDYDDGKAKSEEELKEKVINQRRFSK